MTLEDVKLDFELWRANKIHRGDPVPDELWQKVYVISKNYRFAQIRRTLNLSYEQLKRQMNRLAPEEFIEIPIKENTPPNNGICQIKLTHGNKILSVELPVNQMNLFIPSLEKLMQ